METPELFDALGVYWALPDSLFHVDGRYEVFRRTNATRGLFEALGVRPFLGSIDEGYVISHAAWQSRFGGRADIVGLRVAPEGAGPEFSAPIVAVLPSGVTFPDKTNLWHIQSPQAILKGGPSRRLGVVVSIANGQHGPDRRATLQRLLAESGAPDANRIVVLEPVQEYIAGLAKPALRAMAIVSILFISVALVATANLSLAGTSRRLQECRMMVALGCPVWRVTFGALTDLIAVSALALIAGALTTTVLTGLTAYAFPDIPAPNVADGLLPAAAVAALICVVSALVTTVLILRAVTSPAGVRLDRAGGQSAVWKNTRRAMVMTQVVLAAALAMVAGVAAAAYMQALGLSRQLAADQVVMARTRQPVLTLEERGATVYPYRRFLLTTESTADSLGGVGHTVAYVAPMPVTDAPFDVGIRLVGGSDRPDEQRVALYAVSPSFFDVMRIRLLAGRGFGPTDRLSPTELATARGQATGVAVVSARAAAALGGAAAVLGGTVDAAGPVRSRLEIIGVVEDFKGRGLDKPWEAALYVPYAEFPRENPAFAIRTGAPDQTARTTADRLRTSTLPIAAGEVIGLDQAFLRSLSVRSVTTVLVAYTALCSIVLACASVFGLLAFIAHAQRRDIGIFLALGLTGHDVRRRLTQGLSWRLLLSGVAGIVIGVTVVRLAQDLLMAGPQEGVWIGVGCALLVTAAAMTSAQITAAAAVDPNSVVTMLKEP